MAEETFRERVKRGARRANVTIEPAERMLTRTMSEEEAFLLQEGGHLQVTENFRSPEARPDDAGITVTHTRPKLVLMWKPTDSGRYTPRAVSESTRAQLLSQGWKIRCPDCGTNHESSPYPPGEANSCPAHEPVAMRICPVCGHRIYDNLLTKNQVIVPDDPNIIQDEYEKTTPEQRTRLQLDIHEWVVHPRDAQARGISPLPPALRELIEASQAGKTVSI